MADDKNHGIKLIWHDQLFYADICKEFLEQTYQIPRQNTFLRISVRIIVNFNWYFHTIF